MTDHFTTDKIYTDRELDIEIVNNTRGGIVIFFTEKKGTRFLRGKPKSRM